MSTADKIELINRLSATGLRSIEATSFVSPKWIPQPADAAEVYAGIQRRPGVHYPVLVPNEQGYDRARAVGVEEVAVFTAASEAFNRTNTNAGIDESLARFEPILRRAAADGVRVRGYVSTVLGCPYQGEVPLADVVRVARALHQMGCYEISLGDTIGVGTAQGTGDAAGGCRRDSDDGTGRALPRHLRPGHRQHRHLPGRRRARGRQRGLRRRWLPVCQGASGNVASEDVVYLLQGLGLDSGVDLPALAETGRWLAGLLGRATASRTGQALAAAG